MKRNLFASLAFGALGLVLASSAADAQVVQKNSKVTGPRGKSIEREVRTERSGNTVKRDIRIERPAGTFERSTEIQRPGAGRPGGPPAVASRSGGYRPGGGGGGGYGGGPRVIERNVFVERNFYAPPPRPRGPSIGLFFGGPVLPPPPPLVYVAPQPVYVSPPPVYVPEPQVVYQPPVRYAAPAEPEPETVVVDPVADAVDRLRSNHDNSRRDGALTLGRLGDARAVGPLMDRLAKDGEQDVRVAAAWALGEIGDPRAAIEVQKAALYDKKREVRDAANIAYRKLGRAPIAQVEEVQGDPVPDLEPLPPPPPSPANSPR